MAFEVISVGTFIVGLVIGFALLAAAAMVGKIFTFGDAQGSMVPKVLHGFVAGILAVLGTIAIGMSIGFGCANPDYYEDQVEGPEESAQLPADIEAGAVSSSAVIEVS